MKTFACIPTTLVLLFAACSSAVDHDYIRARAWIYESGYHVDDELGFDFKSETHQLRGDTIVVNGVPKAVVTALYKGDNILKIRSVESGEEGKYLDKVEYTR
jgi:hypothetical protein